MVLTPHMIYGKARTRSGTAIANLPLVITNNRTGDTQNVVTNSSGDYLIDCVSFSNGYENNDLISVEMSVDFSNDDFEFFVTTNGDETYPTWYQVENEVRSEIPLNTARVKINTTRHGSGVSGVNITKNG